MGSISISTKTNAQFDSTERADPILGGPSSILEPIGIAPSSGPVFLEGRLVLSLSFQNSQPELSAIEDDDVVLESYRLWDDMTESWHEDGLIVLRFEHADVVMRLEPAPTALWAGALDTRAHVIAVPDLDAAGLSANQGQDLRWKRT